MKPRAWAQRRYMRSSIPAQSMASVPPAPACTGGKREDLAAVRAESPRLKVGHQGPCTFRCH